LNEHAVSRWSLIPPLRNP